MNKKTETQKELRYVAICFQMEYKHEKYRAQQEFGLNKWELWYILGSWVSK